MRLSVFISVLTVVLVFGLAGALLASTELKTVYVVVPTHLDIGFTAPPDTVARSYKECIDHAIELCEKYSDYFYTIECAWQLREWMKRSSPEEIRKLSSLVKSGKVEIGGAFASMHSGMMSGESVNRMFDLGSSLAQELGGQITTVIQDDVPGYTWAYPQAMGQHGIKYFLTGINTSFGGEPKLSRRDVPFYWEGPDGSRVLTWIAFGGYVDGNQWGVGLWENEEDVLHKVPEQVTRLEKAGYPYDAFLAMASPGDNVGAAATEKVHRIIRKWNATGKHPLLKMATPRQFFSYMEEKYRDRFPVYRGDWSGHWAPAKLGSPRLIARMRYAQRVLPAVESLWSLLALNGVARFPSEDIASAWDDLLTISEHSAAAGTGWPDLTTKEQVIWENWQHAHRSLSASYGASMLMQEGMESLAESVTVEHPCIVVFNSLPWKRTACVEVNLPAAILDRGFTISHENGGEELECDLLEDGRTVRFLARDVPGVGYRLFRVGPGPVPRRPVPTEAYTLDTETLTVTIDRDTGYVASVCLKGNGGPRECVEKGRLFGSLYLVSNVQAMMVGTTRPAKARASRVQLINGKTYKTLRIRRDESALPETSVTVVDRSRAIRIENVLDTSRIPGSARIEALLEFPFNLDAQSLKIALDGPNHFRSWPDDFLPGTARVGQAVQSYAFLRDEKAGVHFIPVEAPILSFGRGGFYSLHRPTSARIYSYLFDRAVWGRNEDTGRTRYDEVEPALGSKISFTYYVQFEDYPGPDDSSISRQAGSAPRVALEATVPLFYRFLSPWGRQEGKLGDAPARGFLEIAAPNIELSSATLLSPEGRPSWQLRLQEVQGLLEDQPQPMTLGLSARSAWLADAAGGKQNPLPMKQSSVMIPISHFKTVTLLIQPDGDSD